MTPRKKTYRKEYAAELLRIAEGDLESAATLASALGGRKENVLFLTQQSVEKCLKAVLVSRGLPIIHTHDIEALIAVLPTDCQPLHAKALIESTEYATVRHYEEGYEVLSEPDLRNALLIGQQTIAWAREVATSKGDLKR